MKCPNCNNKLIEVERNDIELEYCPNCEGFFLNVNEWNLIRKELKLSAKISDILLVPPVHIKTVGESARFCPYCNQVMEKVNIEGLILDRCPNRHGVWFDKNELSDFINKNNNNTQGETVSFLGEVFLK